MAFVSIPYELLNADGSRAVVGNSVEAAMDPDFVAYLDAESGITGLLDRASVRESSTDLVEADGASHGPFWLSRRSGTVTGVLFVGNLDPALVAAAESKLKRATRNLREDGLIRWTPPDASSPRQLRVRVQDGPRITARRPKAFQVTLVSADPYALASSESSVTITAGAAAGEIGMTSPITDPITTTLSPTGQDFAVNEGDAPTWPRFTITGPITNPQILNNTTGELLALSYTLGAGEFLDVYPQTGRILLGGATDRYSALDFANSTWFQLIPGSNDVRLLASSFSAPASVQIFWQHAYE